MRAAALDVLAHAEMAQVRCCRPESATCVPATHGCSLCNIWLQGEADLFDLLPRAFS